MLPCRCAASWKWYWRSAALCACLACLPHLLGLACWLLFVLVTIPGCPEQEHELPLQLNQPDPSIHVVYAGDSAFFVGLLHSMLSLARHLEQPRACTIHLVVARAERPQAVGLVECFRRELGHMPELPSVLLHDLRPLPFDVRSLVAANLQMNHRMANNYTFVRLYLHEYLPTVSRVLWLDSDTIVRADVAPLFRLAMRHPIAAARSTVPMWSMFAWRFHVPHARRYFKADSPAFNAGVLLLDLERWRSGNISRSLEGWLQVTKGTLSDQAVLILEFQGRFDVLDWRWNVFQVNVFMSSYCTTEARVVHYTGGEKPWNSNVRPFKLFFQYCPSSTCSALNWTCPSQHGRIGT